MEGDDLFVPRLSGDAYEKEDISPHDMLLLCEEEDGKDCLEGVFESLIPLLGKEEDAATDIDIDLLWW